MEIPVEATVIIETETTERFKQLVEHHYREPVNEQFEDFSEELPPGEEIESSNDEDDLDIASEQ